MSGPLLDPNSPKFAEAITKAFRNAVRKEVDNHLAAGRPVPGYDKDGHYYLKPPDGVRVPLPPGEEGTREFQRVLDAAAKPSMA